MSIHNAAAIVARLGPCRIALDLSAHGRLAQELALLGCELHTAPDERTVVGFVEWPRIGAAGTLVEAVAPYRGVDTLVLQSAGKSRDEVERALFAEGWSRHPGGMNHAEYAAWNGHALPPLSYYCRARAGSGEGLLGLGGVEGDAVIARYAQAANHVRLGDTVLVDGAYAADGARILEALSQAATVRKVADAHSGSEGEEKGAARVDPTLRTVADRSLDLVVAMQPAMPRGWEARLDDYMRVLKSDGRLVLVIRSAQQPGEALPADWPTLNAALSSRFLVESRYELTPLTQDPLGARMIAPVPLDQASNGPWFCVVVSANPLAGADQAAAFRHPAFEGVEMKTATLADFGNAYDNPWLYRSMVQMGERLGNEETLTRLAEYVIANARPGSADQGAALTVYGYRVLETRAGSAVGALIEAIRGYVAAVGADAPPHVGRWAISLSFLAGRLCELVGDRDEALNRYRTAAEANWQAFSPILATKAVGAAFYEARIHIANGHRDEARRALQQGVDTALHAAASSHREHMGDPARPLHFYLTELAEVIDMGSQCANALSKFHLLDSDPGLFWRQVDVRRFGLATWNGDVERENRQLRSALLQKCA
ncbi:hypothetical protein EDF56_10594 [Novosphingobium sp. PhB165]|uniref:hypothetical protein n=1 Tax=Novosphingobium sp. PhB165 TaxID=2485105 RepID=UPI0010508D1E|nr:hypothetical protein [Novosphingobium sp. PhB165]TCM17752.1 hypothetical protein EDF56_10594 [Novosphingobium sp. PhB165]